jgi:hypothetical protein
MNRHATFTWRVDEVQGLETNMKIEHFALNVANLLAVTAWHTKHLGVMLRDPALQTSRTHVDCGMRGYP